MKDVIKLLTAIVLTVVIELIALFLLKLRDKRLRYSIIINILTNMMINSFLSYVDILWLYILFLAIAEIIVVVLETYYYNLIKKDEKNWQYSLIANLSSFIIGSSLFYLFFEIIF